MFSHFLRPAAWILVAAFVSSCSSGAQQAAITDKVYIEPAKQQKIPASTTSLRVCADPNNLPFSNDKREGFENKIADMLGKEMDLPVEYTWWAERRGFFRNTLKKGDCDVVIGVPAGFEMAVTTRAYYRSTYVFVTRTDSGLHITSLDDPQLKNLRIGVQMVGDDGANTPPAHAMAARGIIDNIRAYTLYGDYREPNPPARIVDAVVAREVDVAIVWGPLAGYFASRQKVPLKVEPVTPQIDLPNLPFVYDIAVGVRRGENELRDRIDGILASHHDEIEKILAAYHVPQADPRLEGM